MGAAGKEEGRESCTNGQGLWGRRAGRREPAHEAKEAGHPERKRGRRWKGGREGGRWEGRKEGRKGRRKEGTKGGKEEGWKDGGNCISGQG